MTKIMLDAGHYGKYNRSPAVSAYYESEAMWKLHLMLKSALETYGFIVGTTRAEQAVDRELYDRGNSAAGYDLFISLHSNAVGSYVDDSIDYPLVIVPVDGKGSLLGEKIANAVHSIMNTTQKGRVITRQNSKGRDWYGVIRGATAAGAVGIIIEHSFHTNTAATNWLLVDDNLQRMANAEAALIADYYGMREKACNTNPVLRRGDRGDNVRRLQTLLNMAEPSFNLAVDGSFGALTEAAVKAFQEAAGLIVNGVCDSDTWAVLLAVRPSPEQIVKALSSKVEIASPDYWSDVLSGKIELNIDYLNILLARCAGFSV